MASPQDFAAAFNRCAPDALTAMFTRDATYDDLFYGRHTGEKSLREMFARMFHEGRDYRWSMDTEVTGDGRAAATSDVGRPPRASVRSAPPQRTRT